MRIAMVTPFPEESDRISGGVAGVAVYLSEALANLPNVDVEIIASNATQKTGTHEVHSLRTHYLGPSTTRVPGKRLYYDLPALVERTARDLDIDIVHVQSKTSVAARLSFPNVLTIHGIAELDALWNNPIGLRLASSRLRAAMERGPRRRITNAIIISPYVRSVLGSQLNCRTWDIPNPVAASFFEIEPRPEAGRILYAGVISPRKNVDGMLRALALLVGDFPHVELHLAGAVVNPRYSRRCLELVDALGISNNVRFLGSLAVAELQEEIAAACCLLLPSFQETAPLVIEEAMAAALPVIASSVGGIPEMVRDGATGWLVDPGSPRDIADKLTLAMDSQTLAQIGLEARRDADRRFRASAVAQQTLAAYKVILDHT